MTANILTELAWLPKPPADFRQQCRALDGDGAALGPRLQQLAGHALDNNQLKQLAGACERVRANGSSLAPLVPFKLGLVSNATTSFLRPALIATALRHGIALDVVEAEFDQAAQASLDPHSAINRAGCDAVLLALDFRGLPLGPYPADAAAARSMVTAAVGHIDAIRAGLHRAGTKLCIVQNIAHPPESLFGSFDVTLPGTTRHALDAVNRALADSLGGEDVLLDVAGLAASIGLANWHDPKQWHLAKLPFSYEYVPIYADHVARIVAALRGKSRRCLVLDLDNTLWGGVIGDDGIEGILLGQGDATGEAHLALQHYALALRNRGIVLAVCSQNNDEIARRAFREHPGMLLREEHVAVFQANWNDKASNILAIARELALGLESLVFVDDNPYERTLVRTMLSQVAVPELPSDPALYARTLSAAGYFEAIAFSEEDAKRNDFYRENARRAELQKQAVDIESYLASLAMVVTFQPFDETNRPRIAQLIAKSNQYNLTTRRYTEAELRAIERDPAVYTLQARLADAFGDNGMISVVICRRDARDWHVDTWLMSCRVLGRRVENAILQELLDEARRRGVERLVGLYRPSPRNKLVEDHYEKLGFVRCDARADGATEWEMQVAAAPAFQVPMQVRRLARAD